MPVHALLTLAKHRVGARRIIYYTVRIFLIFSAPVHCHGFCLLQFGSPSAECGGSSSAYCDALNTVRLQNIMHRRRGCLRAILKSGKSMALFGCLTSCGNRLSYAVPSALVCSDFRSRLSRSRDMAKNPRTPLTINIITSEALTLPTRISVPSLFTIEPPYRSIVK
jgi:hypothetical protein